MTEVIWVRLIEINALSNGAHRNQTINAEIPIPDGWCVIPEDIACENFPFGEVEAAELDGVMTMVRWTPGDIPVPEPEAEIPSQLDQIEAQVIYTAMMTDTLLEV